MPPMESQAWRRKGTVTVLYSYSYQSPHGHVGMREGERLILLEKSNNEWWQVRRPGDKSQPFYAPANYLHEDGRARKSSTTPTSDSPSPTVSRSDDSLTTGPFTRATGKWPARLVNGDLRKQRSTSMDAIMFLELLENETSDSRPSSQASRPSKPVKINESIVDKFKKPRISKDLWERRKSWAVEETTPPITTRRREEANKRHSISNGPAPPLPPRQYPATMQSDKQRSGDVIRDSKKPDRAPALPPKRSGVNSGSSSPAKSSSPDHYSRVIAVRSSPTMTTTPSGVGGGGGGGVGRLTESLEKLAEQIGGPSVSLSFPHPIPPPRRSDDKTSKSEVTTAATTTTVVVVNSDSPPKLPPKMASRGATPPTPMPRSANTTVSRSPKETPVKDNYVNLLRPVTVIDAMDDIQSDESGINMSFNNPLFSEREEAAEVNQQERSDSFNDLDSSSIDDERMRLNGSSSSRRGGSESNLSGELDVTYDASSSSEDLLSSKDSINSIPSLKGDQRMVTGSLTKKPPPQSPGPNDKPLRELFEGWCEYRDRTTNRPFYYNRETRSKSWKPPRKRHDPMIRGASIEEEPDKEMGGAKSSYPFGGRRSEASEAPLSSSADSASGAGRGADSTDDDVDASGGSRPSSSLLVHQRRRVVAEAVRSRKLPPAPPGWIECIEGEEVVYVNSITKARWYTSLDAEGRIYFYEEDSNESLWALPIVITTVPSVCVDSADGAAIAKPTTESEKDAGSARDAHPVRQEKEADAEAEDRPTELNITPTVYYPEGSLAPEMRSVRTSAASPASGWSIGRSRASKAERSAKARSMVLTNFTGRVEDAPLEASGVGGGVGVGGGMAELAAKAGSLPRNMHPQWPTLQGGSIRVLNQGILQKTKLTENGKKVRKSWSPSWVVLTDLFLFLFKESASKTSLSSGPAGPTLDSATNKIELCVDLNGAKIEWAAVKSSRKGVFQVSTLLGVQILLQDEDESNALVWFKEIEKAINRLPHSADLQQPMMKQYPPVPALKVKKSPLVMTKSAFPSPSAASDSRNIDRFDRLSPPSPTDTASINSLMSKKQSKLQRTKSTKVPFLGSTEDLTATSPERQVKLRDKLRKFFVRRPTVDALVKKGIYKDEPVFGCYLSDLCNFDRSTVPRFVQMIVQLIESKPENMKADGIYRASGNLSQIQKLRCHVDQYKWSILETEEDVHALTGCLKLFFRELKEPLIPFPLIEQALKAALYQGPQSERVRRYREVIDALPVENYDTLKYLLNHLLKITDYREFNRMQISNLAIVFGPTLMWTATASNNLALDMMQQNIVVEALLNHYKEIFVR